MVRETLRDLRIKHGFTQADMAKVLDLKTKAAYAKKELGYTPITVEEGKKLADALDSTVDRVFLPANRLNRTVCPTSFYFRLYHEGVTE